MPLWHRAYALLTINRVASGDILKSTLAFMLRGPCSLHYDDQKQCTASSPFENFYKYYNCVTVYLTAKSIHIE